MLTRWGKALDPENILPEYPRPQLARESWLNLNGSWQYTIRKDCEWPENYAGTILVPFSPESELSGVQHIVQPNEWLWYQRSVKLPDGFFQGKLLLHFGAVDQTAEVFINGKSAGTHTGGFTAFTLDITEFWHMHEENQITVRVQDLSDTSWHSRGKQKIKRGDIWYTPQSGIWQTVWMESLPFNAIDSLRIKPDYDHEQVEILVSSAQASECVLTLDGHSHTFTSNTPFLLPVPDFRAWTVDDPYLYYFDVRLGEDKVRSYFGMRCFSVEPDKAGKPRLCLNHQALFHSGLLDQGYYSDGMLTPPSDEAMIHDIQTAKELGFNMLRKHIKIEPLRWYYHCDRLGMLVWQDMINGGGQYNWLFISAPVKLRLHFADKNHSLFKRTANEGRDQYYIELREMIEHLYNCVSLALWVPFNEAWGQFDALKAVDVIRSMDTTRPIDHASGWYDQGGGDFSSHHVYFRPYHYEADKKGRAVILSEFGGYNYREDGHCFSQTDFGYKRLRSREKLLQAFTKLYEDEVIPAKEQGLAAAVYTQLSDVEDELNGMLTYDREVLKVPPEAIQKINKRLIP